MKPSEIIQRFARHARDQYSDPLTCALHICFAIDIVYGPTVPKTPTKGKEAA
jgi:hypothetical protein